MKLTHSDAVVRRISVRGTYVLETPAHFGGDATDLETDMRVLRDPKDRLFVPGASITGACRAYLRYLTGGKEAAPYADGNYSFDKDTEPFEPRLVYLLFGGTEKRIAHKDENTAGSDANTALDKEIEADISQSALSVHDATFSDAHRTVRDGVRINAETGQADATGKYDFEIIERGAQCDLRFDLVIRQWHVEVGKAEEMIRLFDALLAAFGAGELRFGAKTRRGFGRGRVGEWLGRDTAFIGDPNAVLAWLKDAPLTPYTPKPQAARKISTFDMRATFILTGSLLVRTYPEDAQQPDAVQVRSRKEAVIPATSAAGVIRHRAERILNTLDIEAKERIEHLFGMVDEPRKEQRAARLRVEEELIAGGETEAQSRIRIDRLTGGVMPGGLFDEQPVWGKGDTTTWQLSCRLYEPKDWEIGLLLHVLKDLWLGDLTLGGGAGIGRGVLRGQSAMLTIHEFDQDKKECTITETGDGLRFGGTTPDELNTYAAALNKLRHVQ